LREIERATERRLREIERARAEQLDIARSWILLFTLAATFGLWWVFYNQLKLDFYVSWLLGFVVAFLLRRILSFYVGMLLGKKYNRQLKDQLLGR
jgi:membrane protein implicated in regulation of membrane protease activity